MLFTSRFDSLVVGCPLCNLERGVVYFYVNNNGALTSDPVRIQSPCGKIGRFGLSVENIGDLDGDGFKGMSHYLQGFYNVLLLF